MANPRQRRKSRSSNHKPVKHSQRAQRLLKKQPPIKGPKVLQDAWDGKKTVRQNYAALGLMHSTRPQAVQIMDDVMVESSKSTQPRPTRTTSATKSDIPKGFGRIVRDENGNVVRVELPDEEEEEGEKEDETPWGEVLDDGVRDAVPAASKTDLVRELEKLSSTTTKKTRTASTHEVVFLRKLVAKYGEDVEAMSRDLKLNVWQKTSGELKRSIAKAGGFQKLIA